VGSDAESGAAGERGVRGEILYLWVGWICGWADFMWNFEKGGTPALGPAFRRRPPAPRGYADQYVGGLSVRDYHM
jgi:hypothetical protein